jgi:RNA polymerase sigma-70 factor (ECF subfamily)
MMAHQLVMPGARSRLVRDRADPIRPVEGWTFEDLFRKEYPSVVALALALSGSRWVAEELAQEAFIAAHRNWSKVAGYDQPGAWVRRVVTNLATSTIRRRIVEAKALVRLGNRERDRPAEAASGDVEFWDAVRSLPRRQAQVVALHYLEDLSVAEVAGVLEVAPGTVKKHLHDGRKALARRLHTEEEA